MGAGGGVEGNKERNQIGVERKRIIETNPSEAYVMTWSAE